MKPIAKMEFSSVSFAYGDKRMLHQFDLRAAQGEFISLIGPSGVGKTTMFQLACGLLTPTDGEIKLDGHVERSLLGKVGYMPQKDLLLPWRTIAENAALPLELQGVPQQVSKGQVSRGLEQFGLSAWGGAFPHQLSGGMRQRVSLLRTTLTGCDMLLLDEPFSALDGITRMEMQEWLLEMWERLGSTVIMITHDIDEAILLSDRVLVLQETPIHKAVELPIPLERPRYAEARNHPVFHALREQIWQMLRNRSKQHQGGRLDANA